MGKKNPLLTKEAVQKRLSIISERTSIDADMLAYDLAHGKTLNEVSHNAHEIAELAKEQEMEPRTAYAQYIVQSSVVNLCKDIEIIHRRVTAVQTFIPSRQLQYSLQDLTAIIDHFGSLLKDGPIEPDSEVPLSTSMVPDAEDEVAVPEAESRIPEEEPQNAGEIIETVPEIAE